MKCRIKWLSVAAAAMLLFAGTQCQAGDGGALDGGIIAYGHGDYAGALTAWRSVADRGDGEAQQAVGLLYDLGYGVPQDFATALSWYRRAAEGGNRNGQFRLGFMYDLGLGVQSDRALAAIWYHKAAVQDMTAAQTRLAWMYLYGAGVARDRDEALTWIKKAGDSGDQYIASLMFEMYIAGNGVKQDRQRAEEWFRKIPFGPRDFWEGAETLTPLPHQQLAGIVQQMESSLEKRYGDYQRYYAAVSMRKPSPVRISPEFNQYYGLMVAFGQARVAVRGIYLDRHSGGSAPGVSIVSENNLPIVADGGCSVVTVYYDLSRRMILPARCNAGR